MNALIILIPAALILGLGFLAVFIWTVTRGQYDDLDTPGQRALLDDSEWKNTNTNRKERFQ